MSGGSYNYLCHAYDLGDLIQKRADLLDMADRLEGLSYASDAAGETEDLLAIIEQLDLIAQSCMERLRPVWKAVEWWDSSDCSEDQVKEALAEYRALRM